jgi:hypothetical protein
MFSGPFKMLLACPLCRLRFEPEQGFYVGAIYVNYAATMAVVIPGYFLLDVFTAATITQQLLLWGGVTLVFPVVFFRHSRSLWLALAHVLNPGEESERSARA